MLTTEQYVRLKRQNEQASSNNDYSKMIIIGSPEARQMKEFEQHQCSHPSIGTVGGADYCKQCGKIWS